MKTQHLLHSILMWMLLVNVLPLSGTGCGTEVGNGWMSPTRPKEGDVKNKEKSANQVEKNPTQQDGAGNPSTPDSAPDTVIESDASYALFNSCASPLLLMNGDYKNTDESNMYIISANSESKEISVIRKQYESKYRYTDQNGILNSVIWIENDKEMNVTLNSNCEIIDSGNTQIKIVRVIASDDVTHELEWHLNTTFDAVELIKINSAVLTK